MNTNYTFRKSAIEKVQRWELAEQRIMGRFEDKYDLRLPYAAVNSIRLFYLPNNRYRLNNYCCKITVDQVEFDIHSCTYKSLATFGDQSEMYVRFVKELVQKVKAANPDCKILIGQTAKAYYGNLVFTVVAVLSLLFLFHYLPVDEGNFFVIIKLLLIGYLGVYLAKSIRVNKPKQLEGIEIPDYILPVEKNKAYGSKL